MKLYKEINVVEMKWYKEINVVEMKWYKEIHNAQNYTISI